MPNSDFSHCFSSSYHVGVFKQGKFHGTESKMHSLPLQLKHNLPSSFKKHRTKCQILSVLSCDSLPPQLCSHHKFNERSGCACDQQAPLEERDDFCTSHIYQTRRKVGPGKSDSLDFCGRCRPPAPRSPLCTSLWVRRAPKLQRRRRLF